MQTKFAGAGGGNLTLKMQAFSGNPCLTHCGFDSLTFYFKKTARMQFFAGAGGGSRTHMKLPSRDFESLASAISPHQHIINFTYYNISILI